MSLFGTIAHEGSIPAKGIRPKGKGIVVTAVAVVVAIALVSLTPRPNNAELTVAPAAGGLTHQEFVDLNTVALQALRPSSPVTDNSFMYWNVSSLETFSPAFAPGPVDTTKEDFLYWNTDAIEYASAATGDSALGPR